MKKIIIFILIIIGLMFAAGWLLVKQAPIVEVKNFGVTYSKIAAEDFGLDWKEAYKAIFEDLGVSLIRIPVYWPEVEPVEGEFDFDSFDWMLGVAEDNNAEVILAVGRRLPRWPECHEPEWTKSYETGTHKINLMSPGLIRDKLLEYIKKVVERYDDREVVWAWQVENEPFLKFGECPKLDVDFLDNEIALVRSLSNKPIIITDSGEFGDWFRAYKRADIFGSTLYKTVWRKTTGQITYPLPRSFYRLRRAVVELFYGKKPMFICELQAEPWGYKPIKEMNIEEQYSSMDPEKFQEFMEYIKGTGFDTFYFWGVEWWYWLKQQGYPEMWEAAKQHILFTPGVNKDLNAAGILYGVTTGSDGVSRLLSVKLEEAEQFIE
jgi:hypothetical protein